MSLGIASQTKIQSSQSSVSKSQSHRQSCIPSTLHTAAEDTEEGSKDIDRITTIEGATTMDLIAITTATAEIIQDEEEVEGVVTEEAMAVATDLDRHSIKDPDLIRIDRENRRLQHNI